MMSTGHQQRKKRGGKALLVSILRSKAMSFKVYWGLKSSELGSEFSKEFDLLGTEVCNKGHATKPSSSQPSVRNSERKNVTGSFLHCTSSLLRNRMDYKQRRKTMIRKKRKMELYILDKKKTSCRRFLTEQNAHLFEELLSYVSCPHKLQFIFSLFSKVKHIYINCSSARRIVLRALTPRL